MSSPLSSDQQELPSRPTIWLVFSLYYFVPIVYEPMTLVKLAFLVAAYLAFLGIMLWSYTLRPGQAWMGVLTLLSLTTLTGFYTSGASVFYPYAGFLIGFNFARNSHIVWMLITATSILSIHATRQYEIPYFLLPALSFSIVVSIFGVIERMRHETRIQWIQSRQEVEQLAVIAERERIARDLHDLLGHTLSTIVLKADLTDKLMKQQKYTEAETHLEDLHKIARDSLSLVRQTVSGYKHRGLVGEVVELCARLRQNQFYVELIGEIPVLNPRAETAVILALTELTTNVLRHSNGDRCIISFSRTEEQCLIEFYDNGQVEKQLTPGNGLDGVEKRLKGLCGCIEADTHDGCRFTIRLPACEIKDL